MVIGHGVFVRDLGSDEVMRVAVPQQPHDRISVFVRKERDAGDFFLHHVKIQEKVRQIQVRNRTFIGLGLPNLQNSEK